MSVPQQKARARAAAQHAKKTGKLAPLLHCEGCGPVAAVEMHHPDYSKPRDVAWLCRKCHAKAHPRTTAAKSSWVYQARTRLRLSLRELAERAEVSIRSTVRKAEAAEVPNISARRWARIVAVLNEALGQTP